ncbi:response regulator transcription factor [Sphingomonas sp. NFR15]|uniref:response regulator n=1 Tax=Sphingomonas sp. NFR15 TaxID=1566282 RepID=UPI000A6F104E|nr:response regulator transcription factor [Sphingomonas sp. NFR15]
MSALAAIRILIVDDHPFLREGVRRVIETQEDMVVVGEAGTGEAGVQQHAALLPDIVLMDLQMPGLNGDEAITEIRALSPRARVIVLTTYEGDAHAVRALRAGASGYLLKSSIRKELLQAVRSVHAGGKHIDAQVATNIAMYIASETLTEREIAVLSLAAKGNRNKQIAFQLSISEDTVKAHLKAMFAKLGAADRTHAVTLAAKRGLIEL